MEKPKDRLRIARERAGFATPSDAARANKAINKNTLISNENGNRELSRKAAEKYGGIFGVDAGWLLYGESGEPSAVPPAPLFTDVPLISWISAGAMMRDDVADEALGSILVADLPPGDWIALKVVGDSMDRISPPESTIFVDRSDKTLVPNALYVIADIDGLATYKRFRPGPPQRFEPVSVNPAHEPIIPENDPLVVGRVRRSVLDAM